MLLEIVIARYQEDLQWSANIGLPTLVYNKGPEPLPGAIQLPNTGREAHTYLHHIVSRYDQLADCTLFLQGNPFIHGQGLSHHMGAMAFGGFTWLTDHRLFCDEFGMPSHGVKIPVGEMYNRLFNFPRKSFYFGAGALFSVGRELIHLRPRQWWQDLLTMCEKDYPDTYPWVLERLWVYLFCERLGQAITPVQTQAA